MPPVRFEPTISAGERTKTYALDRAATGTDDCRFENKKKFVIIAGLISQGRTDSGGRTIHGFPFTAATALVLPSA